MRRRWIDVSLPLRAGMVRWPGDPPTRITRVLSLARRDPATLSHLALSAHAGTHVDAPAHYLEDGRGVDALPLDAMIGPARVIAIRDPRAVTADELRRHRLRRGERLLLRTRNSTRAWDRRPFSRRFVAVTLDAAKLLAACGVVTVGVDSLSVGAPDAEGQEVHRVLGRAGVCVIEGLVLTGVGPGRYDLCCLPLRVVGADGAPARVALRPR